MPDPTNERAGRTILWGALAAILTLSVFQMLAVSRVEQKSADEARRWTELSQRLDRLEQQVDHVDSGVNKIGSDQDLMQDDVSKIRRKLDDLIASMEGRGAPKADEPP